MAQDLSIDLSDAEFVRDYGPDVSVFKLSSLGLERLESNQLPPKMPIRSHGLMRLLKRLGMAEEDELADYMGLSLDTVRDLLRRLAGYGYLESVGAKKKGGKQ